MSNEDRIVEASDWNKPLPQPDHISREYWSAAAQGELIVQECQDCGERQFYGRALCTKCGGTPKWIVAAGRGVVHTFTIIRQSGMPGFRDELPFVLAMVELDEGPLLMGNITDCRVEDVAIGIPVEVHFCRIDNEIGIPLWRPIT